MEGALIIDKPAGMTSHDVVARVRTVIDQRRVGHTGTLDPFATGVLVVLVGRATRLAQFLSGAAPEVRAHRYLNRLSLRETRMAGCQRLHQRVIQVKHGTHMPDYMADPAARL